ncbi:MAG: cytochrome c-type biogenesis protein CcmH [Amphiplicatus sp.]
MRRLFAILLGLFLATSVLAVEPEEMLADAALEARAEALDRELRCVVCQSQSIAESNADLAREMRIVVRERLTAGDSDKEVLAYLVARYGDYVLLRPPMQANTLILWLFPAVTLIVSAAGAFIYLRRAPTPAPQPLTAEEAGALEALLAREIDKPELK